MHPPTTALWQWAGIAGTAARSAFWVYFFKNNSNLLSLVYNCMCCFIFFSFSFCYQSASDGFWKSVATRVPREPHEIRILNPYFIQEAAFSFIGLPFNNGLMGRGVGIKQNKQNQGEGWETKQQSRLTLFLLFLWASAVGHWREVTDAVMVAALSLLKAKARSFLSGMKQWLLQRTPFLEAALRLPTPAGWFPVTCSLTEGHLFVCVEGAPS